MFPTSPREMLKAVISKMSLDEMCSCPSQRAAYTVLADRMAAVEKGWSHGDIIDVIQFVVWLVSVAFFLWGQYQERRAVDRGFANMAADQGQGQAAIPLVEAEPQLMLL